MTRATRLVENTGLEAHELVRIDEKLALLWAILGSTNTVIALPLVGVACIRTGLLRYVRLRAGADW
jgi:hypothetical protein